MTVINQEEVLSGLAPSKAAAILEQANQNTTPAGSPSLIQTTVDAARQENPVVSAFEATMRFASRPQGVAFGYNVYEDDQEIAFEHPEFAEEYRGSKSPRETRIISNQIQEELARRGRIQRAGGFGALASIAAGVISPESFIPGVVAIRAAGVGIKSLRGARAASRLAIITGRGAGAGAVNTSLSGLASEAVAQLGLQATQRTRTNDELTANLIGAAIFSGALGGVAGAIGESRRGLQQLIGREAIDGVTGSRLSNALDAAEGADFDRLPGDAQRKIIIENLAKTDPIAADLVKDPKTWVGRLWRRGKRWSPVLRLDSSRLPAHRQASGMLSDNPVFQRESLKLGDELDTTVEAGLQKLYGRTASKILRIREIGIGARAKGGQLNPRQFRREVGKAARNGDKPLDSVTNSADREAIREAANEAREIFDEVSNAAEAVGFLSSRDLKGTAKSYATRIWDREVLASRELEFKDRLARLAFSGADDPQAAADAAFSHIMGSRTGSTFIPADFVGNASAFKDRLLLVKDEDFAEFLNNDISEILNAFISDAAPQVEMARAFRTASPALNDMPRRLDAALLEAERTGDGARLLEIVEDTGSLRAASAYRALFSEDGLAKAAEIDRLVEKMPQMRSALREVETRHTAMRDRVTAYDAGRAERDAIQEEVGGTKFDQLPKSVKNVFAQEQTERLLSAKLAKATRLKSESTALNRKAAGLRRRADAARTPERLAEVRAELAETTRAAKAKAAESKAATKALDEARTALLAEPRSRSAFFKTWRRWIRGEEEGILPSTRGALERFSRHPGGRALQNLGDRYVAAVGHVEGMRSNIARVKANSQRLSVEAKAARDALEADRAALLELRKGAQTLDSGVPGAIRLTSDESVAKIAARARDGIADAKYQDALRARNLDAIKAKSEREANQLKRKPGADVVAIQREFENEIRDLDVVRDRLLNKSQIDRQDPHHWAFQAERTFRSLNYVRLMGGVVLSSIPDVGMPIFVNGLTPTITAWRAALRSPLRELRDQLRVNPTATLRELSLKEELVGFITALELASGARVKSFGDISDLTTSGKLDAVTDKVSDAFTTLSGINRWNALNKGVATLASMNRAMRDIQTLAKGGELSASARKNLASSRISESMAKKISDEFDRWGTTEGGQVLPRTQDWKDLDAKRVFQDAMIADVRRTVITPSAGDLPRWMSKPFFRVMGQFKSFSMSATQKVALSGLQRHDFAVMQGVAFLGMLGGLAWALKQIARGEDPFEADAGTWVQNSIDRSGLLGIFMDVNGALERATSGRVGLASVTGAGGSSRFQVRNVTDAFVGPTLGLVEDGVSTFGSVFSDTGPTQGDLRRASKLVPANNIFYWRFLFDKFVGKVGSELGLPENRR